MSHIEYVPALDAAGKVLTVGAEIIYPCTSYCHNITMRGVIISELLFETIMSGNGNSKNVCVGMKVKYEVTPKKFIYNEAEPNKSYFLDLPLRFRTSRLWYPERAVIIT